MTGEVAALVEAVCAWENIVVEPHRFGGREFKLGNVEIGHIHHNGLVDVPFTRAIREQIVEEDLAEPHHILPESGWISFYIREKTDIERAIYLATAAVLSAKANPSQSSQSRSGSAIRS